AYHLIRRPGMESDVAIRARSVVERAKSMVTTYRENREPSRTTLADLAAHALRLAKLDDVVRGGRVDSTFEMAAPEDVEELLALLAIVPFDALLHEKVMLLNPTFGDSSRLLGGADADLVAGDMLIDFKTTKTGDITPEYLDQLLGYFMLARKQ